MDGGSWTKIHGTTIWNGGEKTDKTLFLVLLRFLKATTPFVVFVFYFSWFVLFFVVLSYAVR